MPDFGQNIASRSPATSETAELAFIAICSRTLYVDADQKREENKSPSHQQADPRVNRRDEILAGGVSLFSQDSVQKFRKYLGKDARVVGLHGMSGLTDLGVMPIRELTSQLLRIRAGEQVA